MTVHVDTPAMLGLLFFVPLLFVRRGRSGGRPALLATLPRAMDFPKRFSRRRPESRVWNAILRPVLRRPLAAMLASAGVLLVLALPAFKLHLVQAGIQGLPRDLPVMQTYDRIQAAFPGDAIPAIRIAHYSTGG